MTLASATDNGVAETWPTETVIRVLLADEHPLVSAALGVLLGTQSDIEVVGSVFTGNDVVDACRRALPTVAILDARLPGLEATCAATVIRDAMPATKVMILTSSGHPAELHGALRAGVAGYLRKDVTATALLDAIRRVAAGHQVLDPTVVMHAVSRRHDMVSPTASELRTLKMVANGLSNKEIADRLRLSPGTVRNYVSSLIAKTNARNRVDVIRIARDLAWI